MIIPHPESQPDEIIENILNFLPPESLLKVSSTCKQFRRIWKETPNGIVYNMIIELNYSFKKLSYSMKEQLDVTKFAKETICRISENLENKHKETRHYEFISKFGEMDLSENLKSAISKIDRVDYGEESKYYDWRNGMTHAMEISFGQLGIVRYWEWEYQQGCHWDSNESSVMNNKLKDLNLTNDDYFIRIYYKILQC
ncbi:FBOX domain-containing protein [Naegleria gruberi]|uniref:FBOX domain-containing protein n=1 Tax=Naegleria gruberi TaxID=5762 RepID=D2V8A8_NAEGR|nr:FBOX domain-containing protein [Naegleria gruberi]EFC47012.1 FBOX domain-containing protein [Naegleria gruberi]|eukprot:XP_002679756.1 FBOX domain-containing protein [Naegleria gruberi strain NEG-M]